MENSRLHLLLAKLEDSTQNSDLSILNENLAKKLEMSGGNVKAGNGTCSNNSGCSNNSECSNNADCCGNGCCNTCCTA